MLPITRIRQFSRKSLLEFWIPNVSLEYAMRLRCEGPADGQIYYSIKERKTMNKRHFFFFTLFSVVLRNPSKHPNRILLTYAKVHVGYDGENHSLEMQWGRVSPI